jgi:hypothetical protein
MKGSSMIRKTMFTLLCSALLIPASNAIAGNFLQRFEPEPAGGKFGSRETTLDLFGSFNVPEHRDFTDGHAGFGVGVNHFFTTYIGAGLDTSIDKFDWPNHINGTVIFRYPIEKWSLAPYVFTGFGRQFHDTAQWTFSLGGGLDYRLNARTGVFTDIGAVIPEKSRDSMMWRMGARFRF